MFCVASVLFILNRVFTELFSSFPDYLFKVLQESVFQP